MKLFTVVLFICFLSPTLMGKIGIAVSPANPNRVWAVIEAKKPGLYRSDNGGRDWKLICQDRRIYTRSWYYMPWQLANMISLLPPRAGAFGYWMI